MRLPAVAGALVLDSKRITPLLPEQALQRPRKTTTYVKFVKTSLSPPRGDKKLSPNASTMSGRISASSITLKAPVWSQVVILLYESTREFCSLTRSSCVSIPGIPSRSRKKYSSKSTKLPAMQLWSFLLPFLLLLLRPLVPRVLPGESRDLTFRPAAADDSRRIATNICTSETLMLVSMTIVQSKYEFSLGEDDCSKARLRRNVL